MVREKNISVKTNRLINNSNLYTDVTTYVDQIRLLIEFFDGQNLFVLETPIQQVPSPYIYQSIDPSLEGKPKELWVTANSHNFNTIYDITREFQNLLEQNKEIFIYDFNFVTVYNPFTIDPEHKFIVRYGILDLNRWLESNEQTLPPIPRVQLETPHITTKPKSVGTSTLKHKF